MLPKPVLMQYY